MGVVFCPRAHCGKPVVVDATEKGATALMAECSYCSNVFCTSCRKAWHGPAQPCSTVLEKYRDADEGGRKALRVRFGDQIFEEYESHTCACAGTAGAAARVSQAAAACRVGVQHKEVSSVRCKHTIIVFLCVRAFACVRVGARAPVGPRARACDGAASDAQMPRAH